MIKGKNQSKTLIKIFHGNADISMIEKNVIQNKME